MQKYLQNLSLGRLLLRLKFCKYFYRAERTTGIIWRIGLRQIIPGIAKQQETGYCFAIKDFLLLTTSKMTAAKSTAPFTTFCRFWSTPMMLMPKLRTPIKMAPTITPGTVPVTPYSEAPPMKHYPMGSIS